jgi:hypothetical protein
VISPLSGWVLVTGAVLASPALKAALLDQTMTIETAVVRLLIAMGVSWVGLSLLTSLVATTSAPASPEDEPTRSLPGIDGPLPVRGADLDP